MLAERSTAQELMDDPALPEAEYAALLHDLERVNGLTLAYRPTLAFLDKAVGRKKSFSLLDVGFGNGDMLRRIARWAAARGIEARLSGIDLNPRSAPVAKRATPPDFGIDYRTGDCNDLAGAGFDCIVSSLVAHHMTGDQLVGFLRFMEAEASAGWFVNDLARSPFAHTGWPLLAGLMRWHPIVRHDGRVSIARAWSAGEWRELLQQAGIAGARIHGAFPFRLCVTRTK